MKTTGFQGNLEEKLPVPFFQNLVVKGSFFYPFSRFLHRKHLLLTTVFIQKVLELSFPGILFQEFFADCILRRNQDAITLLQFPFLQGDAEFPRGTFIFRIEKKTACHLVQAVNRIKAFAESVLGVHSHRFV